MALPERFSLLHSELNGFLFATMGTEENGAPLSVLSGLTRLGIDPWAEGARLAKLPHKAAAEALAPIVASFAQDCSDSDVHKLALHLTGLLPRAGISTLASAPAGIRQTRWSALWLFCFVLALVLFTIAMRGSFPWP